MELTELTDAPAGRRRLPGTQYLSSDRAGPEIFTGESAPRTPGRSVKID